MGDPARRALGSTSMPVEAAVCAIVDRVELGRNERGRAAAHVRRRRRPARRRGPDVIRGRVIGEVWATRKAPGLDGRRLVLVGVDGEDRVMVAIDTLGRARRRQRCWSRSARARATCSSPAPTTASCCATRRSRCSSTEKAEPCSSAKVIGTVWSSVKWPELEGLKLLVVRPYSLADLGGAAAAAPLRPTHDGVVCADVLGAGVGEDVVIAYGHAARVAVSELAPRRRQAACADRRRGGRHRRSLGRHPGISAFGSSFGKGAHELAGDKLRQHAARLREHATGSTDDAAARRTRRSRRLRRDQPMIGARMIVADGELLKASLFPAAILACVCVWGTCFSPGEHGFIRRFYETFAWLAPMPSVLLAHHYARLAA